MSKEFIIAPDLMQAIHDYLVTRPMREVEGLVSGLRQCKPVADAAPEVVAE